MAVTREQVVQWADQANGIQVRGAHPGMIGFYPQALIDFVTLARADLEAARDQRVAEAIAHYVRCGNHDDDPYIISSEIIKGKWKEYL